jgi:hypothetical protein
MPYYVDWHNHLIHILAPQVEVIVQDLYDFISDIMQSPVGMNYDEICFATGKDLLDEDITTGITLTLYSPWQLRFWDGAYVAVIKGGNLTGGLDGDPIAYTPNVQVMVIQAVSSTIVQTGGTALTQDEHDKLMTGLDESIPEGVWNDTPLGEYLTKVLNIEEGDWRIINNQMIFFETDGVTEVVRFDLFDENGNPSMESVYYRKRVT